MFWYSRFERNRTCTSFLTVASALLFPFRGVLALRAPITMARLTLTNLWRKPPVVARGGPVVSLTSYGPRLRTVHLTIESIGLGYTLPSRLILWVDNEQQLHALPEALRRLQRRGLEIRLTKNYGPHTKYYPFIESGEDSGSPMVTADDDVLYPRDWLRLLVDAYEERPDVINCFRARTVEFKSGPENFSNELAPYDEWLLCHSTQPSFSNFATGVSGVLYPPQFLSELRMAGAGFVECCPKGDDIWLHLQALRAGYKVRQFVRHPLHFLTIPGTQGIALHKSNCALSNGGNDQQAALSYSSQDLEHLHAATMTRISQENHVKAVSSQSYSRFKLNRALALLRQVQAAM